MKKILLGLLSASALVSVANAAQTQAVLNLNAEMKPVCTSNFSANSLSWTLINSTANQAQNTTYNLTCTAGTPVTGTIASANGFNLHGLTNLDNLNYTLTADAAANTQLGVSLSNANWSAGDGALIFSGKFDTTGNSVAYNVSVAPAATSPTLSTDTYSDTVTVTASY